MSFSGKKVFITTADTRIGRVLGKTFADAGCSVYGLRTCRNELDFAVESYFADYVVRVGGDEGRLAFLSFFFIFSFFPQFPLFLVHHYSTLQDCTLYVEVLPCPSPTGTI